MLNKFGLPLLLSVVTAAASCVTALADDGEMHAVKRNNNAERQGVKPVNYSFNWIDRHDVKGLHIVSESTMARAALVVELPKHPQVSEISFNFEKFKRGFIATETVDPVVCLEYSSASDPSKKVFALARGQDYEQKQDGKTVKATLKLRLVDGAEPIVYRFAVVGVAKKGVLAPDHADFDVWGVKTDKPSDYSVDLKRGDEFDKLVEFATQIDSDK